VIRILLWKKAKEHSLSPIQIQLLIFINYHSAEKTTVTYLAQEFNFTKPTISDALKILEQKKLIEKITDQTDTRSYTISLTEKGKKTVLETENFTDPMTDIISEVDNTDKIVLWENISNLIVRLNKLDIISIQRTCFNCKHYSIKNNNHFCNLLNLQLLSEAIRIDCGEFEVA
jgi:DNA-binding MarR family transcriptional regulator